MQFLKKKKKSTLQTRLIPILYHWNRGEILRLKLNSTERQWRNCGGVGEPPYESSPPPDTEIFAGRQIVLYVPPSLPRPPKDRTTVRISVNRLHFSKNAMHLTLHFTFIKNSFIKRSKVIVDWFSIILCTPGTSIKLHRPGHGFDSGE